LTVGVVRGSSGSGVPRGGPGRLDGGVEIGETVLEGLEPTDDPAELPALLEVGDGRVEAPLRDPDLLRGEQRGSEGQGRAERGRPGTAEVLGHQQPGQAEVPGK